MSHAQGRWSLYETQPSFVLGFHGCDKSIAEKNLRGKSQHLTPSDNDYDWLGNGVYFWEGNPQRAFDFANEAANGGRNSKGKINTPAVLGAIIDLGKCLNLVDSTALEQVGLGYRILALSTLASDKQLPSNGDDLNPSLTK